MAFAVLLDYPRASLCPHGRRRANQSCNVSVNEHEATHGEDEGRRDYHGDARRFVRVDARHWAGYLSLQTPPPAFHRGNAHGAFTGLGFVLVHAFWRLLVVAFVSTLNPSSGDVSVFLPLEQSLLPQTVGAKQHTALFARYGVVGSLMGAVGARFAGVPSIKHVLRAQALTYLDAKDWEAPAVSDMRYVHHSRLS